MLPHPQNIQAESSQQGKKPVHKDEGHQVKEKQRMGNLNGTAYVCALEISIRVRSYDNFAQGPVGRQQNNMQSAKFQGTLKTNS